MRALHAIHDWVPVVNPNKDRWDARTRAHSGTAQAGSANSLTLNPPAANNNATYKDLDLVLVSGPGSVQERTVSAYDGGTKVATVSPGWNAQYLSLPGTSGNYASTPDSAAVSVTGDIDVRVKWSADDWTPATIRYPLRKYTNVGDGSYLLGIAESSLGRINLEWADSGGTLRSTSSSASPVVSDGASLWLRATLDVDNGAGGHVVQYFTSQDYDPATGTGTWTQLGTDRNAGAFTTSIQDGTAPLRHGADHTGKVYYAELRNGIDGTVVAKFDPLNDGGKIGDTSFTASTGEVWTINQSGSPAAELLPLPDATTGYEVRLPAGVVQ